jgi:hypothetical protein
VTLQCSDQHSSAQSEQCANDQSRTSMRRSLRLHSNKAFHLATTEIARGAVAGVLVDRCCQYSNKGAAPHTSATYTMPSLLNGQLQQQLQMVVIAAVLHTDLVPVLASTTLLSVVLHVTFLSALHLISIKSAINHTIVSSLYDAPSATIILITVCVWCCCSALLFC